MSGSMGFAHLSPLIESFLKQSNGNAAIVVISGNNEHLKASLRKNFSDKPQVQILNFTA